jgi:diacylglycerol kinase family enzyme
MSLFSAKRSDRDGTTRRSAGIPGSTWARPAALMALLAVVAALAIGVFAIIEAFGDLIVALGCVFAVVFFAWVVLTRRGLVRLLGVPAGLLGLGLLIAVVGSHVLLLLVLTGVLTLFGGTARFAVRQHQTVVRPLYCTVRPARKGVLIINPTSGGGKAERLDLAAEARKRGIEPALLAPGDDLRAVAERVASNGADVVGMAGGDGSQAMLATVAMRHDVAHVCVPAGTRNHFALDLGLDRDDVVGALDAFTDGVERRIDLAVVNEHIFINNASLGVYAQVVQSETYRNAKLRTWRRMLPEILGPGAVSIDLQFEGPDAKAWSHAALVIVSNNPYQVERFAGAGTRPRLDTGALGILAARMTSAGAVAKLVTLGTLGQAQRSYGFRQWSRREFEVHSSTPVAVGLDGEALVLTPPLRFAALPGVLRVRVPRQASGVSPPRATVELSRGNLRALLEIAAGKADGAPPPIRDGPV